MKRTPKKYVVFSREDLHEIMCKKNDLRTLERLKIAIMTHLLRHERLTVNDVLLIMEVYGIDYQARMAVGAMKRKLHLRRELPEEISFITCDTHEDRRRWDKYNHVALQHSNVGQHNKR